MVNAICQILFQLRSDFLLCSDHCEVCYRNSSCIPDHLAYFPLAPILPAAGTVCTGNILRFILTDVQWFPAGLPYLFLSLAEKVQRKGIFLSLLQIISLIVLHVFVSVTLCSTGCCLCKIHHKDTAFYQRAHLPMISRRINLFPSTSIRLYIFKDHRIIFLIYCCKT